MPESISQMTRPFYVNDQFPITASSFTYSLSRCWFCAVCLPFDAACWLLCCGHRLTVILDRSLSLMLLFLDHSIKFFMMCSWPISTDHSSMIQSCDGASSSRYLSGISCSRHHIGIVILVFIPCVSLPVSLLHLTGQPFRISIACSACTRSMDLMISNNLQ